MVTRGSEQTVTYRMGNQVAFKKAKRSNSKDLNSNIPLSNYHDVFTKDDPGR